MSGVSQQFAKYRGCLATSPHSNAILAYRDTEDMISICTNIWLVINP